jgi:protoporphyrinogen oxidase
MLDGVTRPVLNMSSNLLSHVYARSPSNISPSITIKKLALCMAKYSIVLGVPRINWMRRKGKKEKKKKPMLIVVYMFYLQCP